MDTRQTGLKFILFTIVITLLCSSCILDSEAVDGEYYEKNDNQYKLFLNKGEFVQTLIIDKDTFINEGNYCLSSVISVSPWKEKKELIDKSIGGCMGCELKLKDGKLLYYIDPDDLPVEVFIKKN